MTTAPVKVRETGTVEVQTDDLGDETVVNQYEVNSVLGEGTFGRVYLVTDTVDIKNKNPKYAMKVLSQSFLKKKREFNKEGGRLKVSTALDAVQKEIAIMKKLRHPNVVQLLEVIRDTRDGVSHDNLYLVVDLVNGGQIMTWNGKAKRYFNNNNAAFSEEEARKYFRECVTGLDYLHSQGVVHRDLKPENLLLTSNGSVKIADFGVSLLLEEEDKEDSGSKKKVKSAKGTYYFQPPECFQSDVEYDPYLTDVWGLGVNLFAFVFGAIPYYSADIEELFELIENAPLVIPAEASKDLKKLLKQLLERDVSKRLTMEQIKQDPWVNAEGLTDMSKIKRASKIKVSDEEVAGAVTNVVSFRTAVKAHMFISKMKSSVQKSRSAVSDEKSKSNLLGGEKSKSDVPDSVREATLPVKAAVTPPTPQPASPKTVGEQEPVVKTEKCCVCM